MKSLSRVRPSATPWTAAYQALPSMGFSRQEYWSGVHLLVLLLQFGHSGSACSRSTLVAADMNTLDVAQLLKGLQHNNHHDSGAVGVGNDTARTIVSVSGIAFGDYQRDVVVHTEGTGIVNHDTTILRYGLCKLLRCTGTGRGEGNIDILEIIIMLDIYTSSDFLSTSVSCTDLFLLSYGCG